MILISSYLALFLMGFMRGLNRKMKSRYMSVADEERAANTGKKKAINSAQPTFFADDIGRKAMRFSGKDHRKSLGQFFTPIEVANYMASFAKPVTGKVRILDPGAGVGVLLCAICERLVRNKRKPSEIEIEAYELDEGLCRYLDQTLETLRIFLEASGVLLNYEVINEDFITQNSNVLNSNASLFDCIDSSGLFDIVISNPPYFKIPKADPRAAIAETIVHGQPNIYAIFMGISAALLAEKGQLIFIVPRSFASGEYFRVFRASLFATMRPDLIHLFSSRRDAFKRDRVLQENMIIKATKLCDWQKNNGSTRIKIFSSTGAHDLKSRTVLDVKLDEVLEINSKNFYVKIPVDACDCQVVRQVEGWPGSLRQYGFRVSTGPIVPFRMPPESLLKSEIDSEWAPLLWLNNVQAGAVLWPQLGRKPQYIEINKDTLKWLVPNSNYVLLRRFSTKDEQQRLIAAPLDAGTMPGALVGLENHLNYIHKPGAMMDSTEARGLATLLNSRLLNRYFQIVNGNTQVSATELNALPLPAFEGIRKLGEIDNSARGSYMISNLAAHLSDARGFE